MRTAFERHGHPDLDAHEKPPEALRALFKKYQKMTAEALAADTDVVTYDHERPNQPPTFKQIGSLGATRLRAIFDEFEDQEVCRDSMARSYTDKNIIHDTVLLESVTIPGKRAEACAGNGADRGKDCFFYPLFFLPIFRLFYSKGCFSETCLIHCIKQIYTCFMKSDTHKPRTLLADLTLFLLSFQQIQT